MFGIFYFPFLVTYFFIRFVGEQDAVCLVGCAHYMPEACPFLWVEFFAGFCMVDSTNFLLKPKFFKNFLSSVFYLRTEITNFVPKKKTL